jgi:N-methylhydantoinase B/oxoprolinase/acetone carboxylase alpha subunit
MRFRKLYHDGLAVLMHVMPHGQATPVAGLQGGSAGRGADLRVDGAQATAEPGNSQLVILRKPDDVITVETAGGGGFGDPRARPAELVRRDLEDEVVTPAGLAAYGADRLADGPQPRRALYASDPASPG